MTDRQLFDFRSFAKNENKTERVQAANVLQIQYIHILQSINYKQ